MKNQNKANAQAIAALPELIAALKHVVLTADDEGCDGLTVIDIKSFDMVVAALRKAGING